MPPSPASDPRGSRNARLALICAAVFFCMVGAAFASVPFYKAFCQATGFAGTVRRVTSVANVGSSRMVTVRFDTNVRGLPWKFTPDQKSQTIHLGESKLAFFNVTNSGDAPITGRAVYNVVPESAGPYFSKLECFCFKNQTILPGQTMHFPVVYYVDPRFGTTDDTRDQTEITLSYTFLRATGAATGGAAQTAAAKSSSGLGGSGGAGL